MSQTDKRYKNFNGKLDEMLALRQPGQTFSLGEIARHCGATRQAISNLEHKALKKVEHRLVAALGRESLDSIMEAMNSAR